MDLCGLSTIGKLSVIVTNTQTEMLFIATARPHVGTLAESGEDSGGDWAGAA